MVIGSKQWFRRWIYRLIRQLWAPFMPVSEASIHLYFFHQFLNTASWWYVLWHLLWSCFPVYENKEHKLFNRVNLFISQEWNSDRLLHTAWQNLQERVETAIWSFRGDGVQFQKDWDPHQNIYDHHPCIKSNLLQKFRGLYQHDHLARHFYTGCMASFS